MGINFIYESHILERNKYAYKMSENRLPIVENPLNNTSDLNIVLDSDNYKTSKVARNYSSESSLLKFIKNREL